jgi:hypothetical protein
MTIFASEAADGALPRFRVLVDGFANGSLFQTLHHALNSVPAMGGSGQSFEIYDALERRFVWTRPKQKDIRSYQGAFSIRVNGHSSGSTFASLDEAIASMAVRPQTEDYDVFENEVCIFVKSHPADVRLMEAL